MYQNMNNYVIVHRIKFSSTLFYGAKFGARKDERYDKFSSWKLLQRSFQTEPKMNKKFRRNQYLSPQLSPFCSQL